MLKKWLEGKKAEKEKYRLADEKEKRFFAGLRNYAPEASDTNVMLLKKLVQIAEESCTQDVKITTTDLALGSGLGMDSLAIADFLMATEEEFDIEILFMETITENSTLWDVFLLLHYCAFRWENNS